MSSQPSSSTNSNLPHRPQSQNEQQQQQQHQQPQKPTPQPQKSQTNPRGIPLAPFVDNVTDYVTTRTDVEPTLRSFQEMISKYQFMELNTARRAVGLREKIPDIKKTWETVKFLRARREGAGAAAAAASAPLVTSFELNDTLFAKAEVRTEDVGEVFLWLGANVMLAYPVEEAVGMLEEKLGAAERSLGVCEEDSDFLREQITTLEVATARVYNWDVVQRRKEKAEGKGDEDDDSGKRRPGG